MVGDPPHHRGGGYWGIGECGGELAEVSTTRTESAYLTTPNQCHNLHDMQEPYTPDASSSGGDWITAAEVGRLFGVSRNTVRSWANGGLIPAHRLPSGRLRYRREDIVALLGESA